MRLGVRVRRRVTVVEIKQEAAHVFVINLPPAISFVLRDDLGKKKNKSGTFERTVAPGRRRRTSPQYSEMKSFFWTGSLMKIPHPATSDGASSRC